MMDDRFGTQMAKCAQFVSRTIDSETGFVLVLFEKKGFRAAAVGTDALTSRDVALRLAHIADYLTPQADADEDCAGHA